MKIARFPNKAETAKMISLDGNFDQRKAKILKGLQFDSTTTNPDKSPKGYIDEPIIPLIACINHTSTFYTTSSCSGRISLFLQERFATNNKNFGYNLNYDDHDTTSKKGGEWLLNSHDIIGSEQIINTMHAYINELNNSVNDENNVTINS